MYLEFAIRAQSSTRIIGKGIVSRDVGFVRRMSARYGSRMMTRLHDGNDRFERDGGGGVLIMLSRRGYIEATAPPCQFNLISLQCPVQRST